MDANMAKLVHAAMIILEEEAKLLEQVLLLEEKKYQALKDVNLEAMIHINDQEELLIQEIHTKEKHRQDIFSHLKQNERENSFEYFLALLDDQPQKEKMQSLYIRLANLRDRIKIQSEENKHLIQLNSEVISMTLGLFQKTHGETYLSPQAPAKPITSGSFLVNHIV